MSKKKHDEELFGPSCSFCGRGLDEVIVIPGPGGASICEDCAHQAIEIAEEARRQGGELMGGAMIQLAFNLGNAIGAYLGGLPIVESDPQTYHLPPAIGAVMAAMGVVCYVAFCRRYERRKR